MTTRVPSPELHDFALRLRAARKLRRTTQANLAVYVGVPLHRYQSWEWARAIPHQFEVYARLCRYLGVTVDWLFFGDETALPIAQAERLKMALHVTATFERPLAPTRRSGAVPEKKD